MSVDAKVEQTKPNLPKEGSPVPPPQPFAPAEETAPAPDFWTVEKAQSMIAYAGKTAAGISGNNNMLASRFELEIGGPLLSPWLNKHLPQVPGGDENQVLLIVFVVFFVALRAVEYRKQKIAEAGIKPPPQPKDAAAQAEKPGGGETGQRGQRVEEVLGGQVGSGQL